MDQPVQEAEVVSQSPVPTPKPDVKTLTFPEAIIAVIDGKNITKLEWNDKKVIAYLGTNGYLMINLPNEVASWKLRDADLKGVDYVVVE